MSVEITIDSLDVVDGLTELLNNVESEFRSAVRTADDLVAQEAHSRAPRDTGALERSIDAVPVRGSFLGGTLEGGVQADAPHALAVEDGSVPHEIRARNARFLRFTQGGQLRFARVVRHPGTAPMPFMGPALEVKAAEIEALFASGFDRAASRAGF